MLWNEKEGDKTSSRTATTRNHDEGGELIEERNDDDDEEVGLEKGELRNKLYTQIIDGGTDSTARTHTYAEDILSLQ